MPQFDASGILRTIVQRAAVRAPFVDWSGDHYSYAALLDDIHKCCAFFDMARLDRGARILIRTHNERMAIATFIAALLDGQVPVMLTPDTPEIRTRAIAALVEPGLTIIDQAGVEDWTAAQPCVLLCNEARGGLDSLVPLGQDRLLAIHAENLRPPRCDALPEHLAYILFTSGTTSMPKGVMITHRNLFANLETLSRIFCYGTTSAIFNGMVLAHGDGLVQGPLLTVSNGCRLVRPPSFAPQSLESYLGLIREKRATHFITVPTIYSFIDRYARRNDYFAGDEFIALLSVAAKLEEPLWRRIESRFRRPIYNQYGLTETVASALYAGPGEAFGTIGTIGTPIDVEVMLMMGDGTPAARGEAGEIWLKGDNVSPGYFGDPAATAEKYSGPWLKTGDLAIGRADGAFEIVGRVKTVIMSGGFLINPEEIDEVLLSHPAVVEAVTLGMPDADFGEIPVSSVILDQAADEFELTAHCNRFLEPKKVPRRILPLPSIPRGDAGKPKLSALQAIVATQLKSAPALSAAADDLVLETASQIFRVPRSELSLDSSPQTVAAWDSFAHIALVIEVQRRSDIVIEAAAVAAIDSLRKLAELLTASAEPPSREAYEIPPPPFGVFVGTSLITCALPAELPATSIFPNADPDARFFRISSNSKSQQEILEHIIRASRAGVRRIFAEINPLVITLCSRLGPDASKHPDDMEYPGESERIGQENSVLTTPLDDPWHLHMTNVYPVRVHSPGSPELVREALRIAKQSAADVVWIAMPRSQTAAHYLGPKFEFALAMKLRAFAADFGAKVWRPASTWPNHYFSDPGHLNEDGALRFQYEMTFYTEAIMEG